MKYPFLFLFFVLNFQILSAQVNIISSSPAKHKTDVDELAMISITFSENIVHESVDHLSFKVMGRWSGPMAGTFFLPPDYKSINFLPDEPFFAGEYVTVTVNKRLEFELGYELDPYYSWSFWIETEPGELEQENIGVQELRTGVESWIQTYGAHASDINNDGYSDLLVINENSDDVRILLNDGNGAYPTMEIKEMGFSKPSPNEAVDFNNDGELDFIVTTAHGNEARVWWGDGSGDLFNMDTYSVGTWARGLGTGDFNGDGYEDALIANRGSNDLTCMTNMGPSETFDVMTYDADANGGGETALSICDIDNDGVMDAFVGYYDTQEVGILLGNGTPQFAYDQKVSVDGKPWMIAHGDINGDGWVDVVSANSNSHKVAVILNDGAGNLLPATHLVSNSQFPLAIDLGDLDGDDDLDMVVSYYSSSNFLVFENNGSGQFTQAANLWSPANASCAILHDRDNDGDLDITCSDETDDVLIFYENNLPVSINEIEDKNNLITYPNPFTSTLQMKLNGVAENVSVMDLQGKLVQFEVVENTDNLLRIRLDEQMGAGIYFVSLESGGVVYNVRVTKMGE